MYNYSHFIVTKCSVDIPLYMKRLTQIEENLEINNSKIVIALYDWMVLLEIKMRMVPVIEPITETINQRYNT